MHPQHLVLFARQPLLGKTKGRLAADIGASAAHKFYRNTLHETSWYLGRDCRWKTWLTATPDNSATNKCLWPIPANITLFGQGKGNIGTRMSRVFNTLPAGPIVIIGSDIPEIQKSDIQTAFKALGHNNFVFGPAIDGGYWLIGINRVTTLPMDLFKNVRLHFSYFYSKPSFPGLRTRLGDVTSLLRLSVCSTGCAIHRNIPKRFRFQLLKKRLDIDDGEAWHYWQNNKRKARNEG